MSSSVARLRASLVTAGLVLAAAGGVAWLVQGPTEGKTDQPGGASTAGAPPATGTTARPVRADWEPGAPHRLLVPELGVDAPVVPIATRDDTLIPPADPQRLGWWAEGARPGADAGSALITGHTVHTGGGALDDLEQLDRGDRVVVRTDRGRVVYAVERVRIFSKGTVSDHAERLFSQEVPGRLVLITCEDWDGSRYLSNVVVIANPRSG